MKTKKNIVVIGGGTGTFTVLSALKKYPVRLSAIVSMADDGGSTGILRDQYGVLPPGDVRRALVALSPSDTLRKLFSYRFSSGDFRGHNFGNLFLSSLEKVTGSFASAVREASQILNIMGDVIPVTLDNVRLYAKLSDGKILKGENSIDVSKERTRAPIEKIWLEPKAKINPEATRAIARADAIIVGPGDLFSSIIPNLLVEGMVGAIKKSYAKKIYICNLMTKWGETDGFFAQDFVLTLEKYLGKDVLDFSIFNTAKPVDAIIKKYEKEGAGLVKPPSVKQRNYILTDLLARGQLIRHDQRKLAKVLISLL